MSDINKFDPKSIKIGDTVRFKQRYSTEPNLIGKVVANRIDDPNSLLIKYSVPNEEWVSLERIDGIQVLETVKDMKKSQEN